ncbi:putative aldouronate transport system substrate-binding protein [Paenibacillus rhizosphaerae]|uniref:Putative aldouronate transport system substrate-binding protein n=1 Tax=Paenibacillus rhizosphaerae TaxID=297318 RepID=A0A839TPC0_9BACL|nr:extracellular solute-binding protein [Paenibacillus rhizosphaerae]MBB3128353.1 putative aldouronate transport system substrate-binding protein [Paenibacillus rhizosphaerae]
MKKKALLISSFFLIVVLTLAGCSGKDTTEEEAGDPAKNDQPVGQTSNITSWDSPDLAWKKSTDPVAFDTYIDFDWYPVDTWGKDDVSKEITKRTGVSLNVTKGSDLNQLQVLIAANELPDLVFTSNLVERFYDPDIAYPLDELIKKYAPEMMNLLDPVEIANNTQPDGHFYALKTHYNNDEAWNDPRNLPSPGDAGFYIRQDIMQEIGNPPLESLEDLLNVYQLVKEKHPDMIIYLPHPTWTNPLMEMMGLTDQNPYTDEAGKVHIGFSNPGFKDYFKYMNSLYRNGYLSAESFAYKPEQFSQIMKSGNVFSASYNSGLADEMNKVYDDNGIQAHLVPVLKALTFKGEAKLKPVDASIGWASLFVPKTNKNPERAIQYIEFLKSPEGDALTQWGIEGKHYTLNEDKLLVRPEGFNQLKVTDTGIGPWYFEASGLGEGVAVSSGALSNPKYSSSVDLLKFRKALYVRNPALAFVKPKADTDEFNINVKLSELYTNAKVEIITAASEDEAAKRYDKMMSDANKIGLEQLETYMNEAYQEALKKYE